MIFGAKTGSLEKLLRKSDKVAAIQYAMNLWPALLRYCDDGIIEIDNSPAERALRGGAIGAGATACSPVPTRWRARCRHLLADRYG
jgi:hypothetical protein